MIQRALHDARELFNGLFSKGTFTQNFAVTLSGNVVAQLIGFLITPIIARIYGPPAYGLFALFIGIVNTMAPSFTLQFPSGYAAVRDDAEFERLVQLTLTWLLGLTTLTTIILMLVGGNLLDALNASEVGPLLFLIPIYFLFMGLDEILLGWNIRSAAFQRSAVSRIFAVVLSKSATVTMGVLIGPNPLGIVLGNLLQYPVDSLGKLGSAIRSTWRGVLKSFSLSAALALLKKYKAYPVFVTTGLMISNFGNQLPIYLFSIAFAPADVGLYAMAASLVMLPLNLVVNSATAAFLKKASEVLHETPELFGEMARKLHVRLFWLSFPALTAFALVSDVLVPWLLGDRWLEAGRFAGFLAIGSVLCASSFTLSVIYRQMNRESVNFIYNIWLLMFKGVVLWVALSNFDLVYAVIAFSMATLVGYMVNLVMVFRMLGLSIGVLFKQVLLVLIAFTLVIWLKVLPG